MFKRANLIELIYKLPLTLTIIGIIIHFLGLFRILQITTMQFDALMLIIDIVTAYGLFKRYSFGYYLAIILYIEQSIMQPFWSYKAFKAKIYIIHPIEHFLPSLLVLSCLFILITSKEVFLNQQEMK